MASSAGKSMVAAIHRLVRRPTTLMEVCGTHTVAIGRSGLRSLLPRKLRLLSGPGCPVCVTPTGTIDLAIQLARRKDVVVATFGDMLRVPGSQGSLEAVRSEGGRVQVLYSPRDALELARRTPDSQVVFVGVGFETTAPGVAAALLEARRQGLRNLLVLPAFKQVPPALDILLGLPEVSIQGLILPGHVSAILGSEPYDPILRHHGLPGVVTGFEPEEILRGILRLLLMIHRKEAGAAIEYRRAARPEGNPAALAVIQRAFRPVDARWRGLGVLPGSGLGLAPELAGMDAMQVLELEERDVPDPPGCACGDVLKGALHPPDCPLFGGRCTPADPVGPCMVSSEGACAAYHRYGDAGS